MGCVKKHWEQYLDTAEALQSRVQLEGKQLVRNLRDHINVHIKYFSCGLMQD